MAQTKDLRPIPEEYGFGSFGSSTLLNWIEENIEKDQEKEEIEVQI